VHELLFFLSYTPGVIDTMWLIFRMGPINWKQHQQHSKTWNRTYREGKRMKNSGKVGQISHTSSSKCSYLGPFPYVSVYKHLFSLKRENLGVHYS